MKTNRENPGDTNEKQEKAKERYPGEQMIHKGVVSESDVKEEVDRINIGEETKDRG